MNISIETDAHLMELNDIYYHGIIISGESMSVRKEIGDEIIGATANLSNTIYMSK